MLQYGNLSKNKNSGYIFCNYHQKSELYVKIFSCRNFPDHNLIDQYIPRIVKLSFLCDTLPMEPPLRVEYTISPTTIYIDPLKVLHDG